MAISDRSIDEYGVVTSYHKIDELEFNYDQNCIHIDLKNYASKEYRDQEKAEELKTKEKYDRYFYLKNWLAKNPPKVDEHGIQEVQDEQIEFDSINMNHLESWKSMIEDKSISTTHYTLDLKEEIRDILYQRLMTEIPDFINSIAL